MSLWTFWSDYK